MMCLRLQCNCLFVWKEFSLIYCRLFLNARRQRWKAGSRPHVVQTSSARTNYLIDDIASQLRPSKNESKFLDALNNCSCLRDALRYRSGNLSKVSRKRKSQQNIVSLSFTCMNDTMMNDSRTIRNKILRKFFPPLTLTLDLDLHDSSAKSNRGFATQWAFSRPRIRIGRRTIAGMDCVRLLKSESSISD
jgi:hypothetical protein